MSTSRPTSPIDICNLAMDYLGEAPVNTIDNPTDSREEHLARQYDQIRRLCLRDYVWNFAQKYAVLARTGDGTGQHEDAYLLPNDFVRLNSVGEFIEDPITDYDISEGSIMTSNGNSLPIRYNWDVTSVSLMDAGFINFFALRIAQRVGYKFTKKKSVVDQMTELLRQDEPKASSVDGQERPPRRIERSKYLTARRSGGTLSRDNRYYTIQ